MASNNPIGIFDSGVGGLTVAKAIAKLLPQERLVYFGDTAHMPWGDKSEQAICHYAKKICGVLINEFDCKVIVVACNTASSVAIDAIKQQTNGKVEVINVIDPVVEYITSNYSTANIGLIGTKQTIKSRTYQTRINKLNHKLNIHALATPLLVPLIEEGFLTNKAASLILSEYLNILAPNNIDALILGCTHYPLLKSLINNFYQLDDSKSVNTGMDKTKSVKIIDSSTVTAKKVKSILKADRTLGDGNAHTSSKQFFITDYNEFFASIAQRIFEDKVAINAFSLWESDL